MQILENHPLKSLNSFGIDVKARFFCRLDSTRDILDFIREKRFAHDKMIVLNGGSNILFTGDFDGLVIKINNRGSNIIHQNAHHVLIKVLAGENWDDFVTKTISQGYFGLENLSMIPGNAGAAPIQNIGAYGVEQKDFFDSLEAINIQTGEIETFDAESCQFGYRHSIFKSKLKGQYVILSVTYRLNKTAVTKLEYGTIRSELENMNLSGNITARAVSQAVRNIRGRKLPDPKKTGNAGSFFKNPVVSKEKYDELKLNFPAIAAYPDGNGNFKIAAGWMIDHLGWKGRRRGNAGVCKTQALVLINHGGATGQEIVKLAEEIQLSVKNTFGIWLEPEVNII
jgi:UDP-N-acetylmuramate dehydrogenase